MNGLIHITLGGEQRTLKFNNHSLFFLGRVLKCDPLNVLSEVMKVASEYPMRAMSFVIYSGMMGFFEAKANYEHGIQLSDITEWVADANESEMLSVWDIFKEATGVPTASEEAIKEYQERVSAQMSEIQKKKPSKSKKKQPATE